MYGLIKLQLNCNRLLLEAWDFFLLIKLKYLFIYIIINSIACKIIVGVGYGTNYVIQMMKVELLFSYKFREAAASSGTERERYKPRNQNTIGTIQ